MEIKFNIYCSGFLSHDAIPKAAWAVLLTATSIDDGRIIPFTLSGKLESTTTKNVADLFAINKALQCIQSQYRATSEVTLHSPAGYAFKMLERNPDGLWLSTPQTNHDLVDGVRTMVNKYSKLGIVRISNHCKEYKSLIKTLLEL